MLRLLAALGLSVRYFCRVARSFEQHGLVGRAECRRWISATGRHAADPNGKVGLRAALVCAMPAPVPCAGEPGGGVWFVGSGSDWIIQTFARASDVCRSAPTCIESDTDCLDRLASFRSKPSGRIASTVSRGPRVVSRLTPDRSVLFHPHVLISYLAAVFGNTLMA